MSFCWPDCPCRQWPGCHNCTLVQHIQVLGPHTYLYSAPDLPTHNAKFTTKHHHNTTSFKEILPLIWHRQKKYIIYIKTGEWKFKFTGAFSCRASRFLSQTNDTLTDIHWSRRGWGGFTTRAALHAKWTESVLLVVGCYHGPVLHWCERSKAMYLGVGAIVYKKASNTGGHFTPFFIINKLTEIRVESYR